MYDNLKSPGRNDECWCGSGRKYKKCHLDFDERLQSLYEQGFEVPQRSLLKTPEEIEGIKRSAAINIGVLDLVAERIGAGVSTEEIDKWIYDYTVEHGGIPADLDYEGYPKSVCTSINEVVCHGIPSPDDVLKDGDIVNVDCSTILDGYYSDSSRMFCIGEVSDEKRRLVEETKKAGMVLAPGCCFTIEPMINMGSHDIDMTDPNGWTVRTADRKPSAQWEVQLVVTETGYELLSW